MNKWEVESVIPPDMINGQNYPDIKREEEEKLQSLLEKGFEPFAVFANRIWLRLKLD